VEWEWGKGGGGYSGGWERKFFTKVEGWPVEGSLVLKRKTKGEEDQSNATVEPVNLQLVMRKKRPRKSQPENSLRSCLKGVLRTL